METNAAAWMVWESFDTFSGIYRRKDRKIGSVDGKRCVRGNLRAIANALRLVGRY